ncbi:ribose-phosphate diphosphokinase [Rhodocytophaga rosea]|uniref:ribose-phosphate diphosphokinase n=1 Tax=Rhodocytophaga rosea TaxID=2704465 RepID=A0A6C0GU83_9BACT|nr:ribose-phosphate diphosphokinase [Rhodocytophaga rosea]QHT71384.1 ribose-phosphate diphosphokinase [Rhodocytophaga rosea]
MRFDKKIIFSTQKYTYLQEAILKGGDYDRGEVEVKEFPDGERYQRVISEVNERDIVLVGGTVSDADTLELFDLACTLVHLGAQSLLLIIPYFGYSTMERAVQRGEVVTAKTRAFLLSSIPDTHFGNTVILLDLHTEGLPYYFEGKTKAIHLYAKPVIIEACHEIAGTDFILASTDAGRAKWVESLANDMGIQGAFVFKRRIDAENTQIVSISCDVTDKYVIIYDDMIRTGGSLVNAAKAYKEAGAAKIAAITTHGLFSKGGLEKIKASGLFECVVSTDSHPNVFLYKDNFLKIKTIARVLLEEIEKH